MKSFGCPYFFYPIFVRGMPRYRFCSNSPTKYIDPAGLFSMGDLAPVLVGGDHTLGVAGLYCAYIVGSHMDDMLGQSEMHEEPSDAVLHCITSCLIGKLCGNAAASIAGRYQEGSVWSGDPRPNNDSQNDEAANASGRGCAKCPNSDCGVCCAKLFPSAGKI